MPPSFAYSHVNRRPQHCVRSGPPDKESASPLCSHDRTRRPSELEDADSEGGWLLESFGGAARTNSLYKRGALKHEYQLRRLTAGIEGLVELVPEQLRRASVPEFDEALVSVRHNVISLDQTARSLSEVVNAFHSFDPSAIQDSVQQAVSATLLAILAVIGFVAGRGGSWFPREGPLDFGPRLGPNCLSPSSWTHCPSRCVAVAESTASISDLTFVVQISTSLSRA